MIPSKKNPCLKSRNTSSIRNYIWTSVKRTSRISINEDEMWTHMCKECFAELLPLILCQWAWNGMCEMSYMKDLFCDMI